MLRFENEFVGLTVLSILTSRLGFSRKAITRLKKKPCGIMINGSHATVRAVLREGDVLTLDPDDTAESQNEKLIPSSSLPSIIYEDDDIVIVNKPYGMPTHQSHGHFDDTLANSLSYYYGLIGRPFVFRAVNRLDKNTSGAVLVAKNSISAAKLSRSMQSNGIEKSYIAILSAPLAESEGEISTYIRRKEKSVIFREICGADDEGAKPAITKYKVLAQGGGLSLVRATLVTGRTHQLRLHFAHLGASILGDDLYGSPSDLISRHALHAYSLTLTPPSSEHRTTFFAELPSDMLSIINKNFNKEDLENEFKKQ